MSLLEEEAVSEDSLQLLEKGAVLGVARHVGDGFVAVGGVWAELVLGGSPLLPLPPPLLPPLFLLLPPLPPPAGVAPPVLPIAVSCLTGWAVLAVLMEMFATNSSSSISRSSSHSRTCTALALL